MKTNFDLGFSSALVLRTPAYSFSDYKAGTEPPLDDSYFRTAILIASPVLYRQLEKKEFKAESLNERERQAILKYWNRACFRPTPFGLFSGVAYTNWGHEDTPIILSANKKLHTLFSYEKSVQLAEQWMDSLDEEQRYYTLNSSIYLVGKEYRHLQFEMDDKTGNKEFIINAVEKSKALQQVLGFLKVKRNQKELRQFVQATFSVTEDESRDYVAQLIKEQIITSIWQPNITGKDYLQQLSKTGLNKEFENHLLASSVSFAKSIGQDEIAQSLKKLQEAQNNTSQPAAKSPFYIITEHPVLKGSLSDKFQNQINEALQCSALLNKKAKSEHLQGFVKAFTQKYDQQWVPLMEALDPEIGIGYLSLGVNHNRSVLLEGIEFNPPENKKRTIEWTSAHNLLMNKISQYSGNQNIIQITCEEISQLNHMQDKFNLPPSMAVMFRSTGDQLYIEQAGGASALGLIGRFTPLSADFHQMAKEIAEQEQSTNPDVVFAELIYIAENHTANIDRREIIYPYEILVTGTSTQPEEKQILLSDLWLAVSGEEILLWSQRLRKRIIPRLSSAYNYQRSSLAVFRLLGDLQYQGLYSNLNFDLAVMFPGLNYYPRIELKQTILSLRMWRLTKEHRNAIISLPNETAQQKAVVELCRELRLPDMITINEHDHQLAVNIDEPPGIQLLLALVKTSNELLLKEFPFTRAPSVVTGENKKPFGNQFVAALYNRQKVYKTEINHYPVLLSKTTRKFMPGSKWLYFKIYCHPYRSNELLTKYLLPCIQSLGKHIKQYFFIRYQDNGYHIRLRLLIDPSKEPPVIQVFRKKLEPLLNDGIISGFSTEVYIRELERYTTEIIDQVEDYFCASSVLVITHLLSEPDAKSIDYYRLVVRSIELMMDGFNLPLEKKERLCNFQYQSFAQEFGVKGNAVQQFKLKYRKLKEAGLFSEETMSAYLPQHHLAKSYRAFDLTVKRLNKEIAHWHPSQKDQLLSNLIHMHLNRLFVENPREQELIIHYCLSAWYHGEIGRKKQHQGICDREVPLRKLMK